MRLQITIVANKLLTNVTCRNVSCLLVADANTVYANVRMQLMKIPSITTLTQTRSFPERQLPIEVRPLARFIWTNYTFPRDYPITSIRATSIMRREI